MRFNVIDDTSNRGSARLNFNLIASNVLSTVTHEESWTRMAAVYAEYAAL